MLLFRAGGEPAHRPALLERHRPRLGQQPPSIDGAPGAVSDLEVVGGGAKSSWPDRLRVQRRHRSIVFATNRPNPGSDSQPSSGPRNIRRNLSPDIARFCPDRDKQGQIKTLSTDRPRALIDPEH